MGAMEFAKTAMGAEGEIARLLDDGACPFTEENPDDDHEIRFIFAFAEAQNEEVGGLYAEGDVIHAYAHCTCGESYSHKSSATASRRRRPTATFIFADHHASTPDLPRAVLGELLAQVGHRRPRRRIDHPRSTR